MKRLDIGVLHPGAMGAWLARSAVNTGHRVYWVSEGRSDKTRRRAEDSGLSECEDLALLCRQCSIIISVCPPQDAESLASHVARSGFHGLYADVNAISPDRARRIAALLDAAGIGMVDGGIIGVPTSKTDTTWLYLAGDSARRVAECFAAGPLATEVLGGDIGSASALKMCYAARTKGTIALWCAILAAAEKLGIRASLERHWATHEPALAGEVSVAVTEVAAKAWRFAPEMQEISHTLMEAGLPGGFHEAAAELYRRIAAFKDAEHRPDLQEVVDALAGGVERRPDVVDTDTAKQVRA